MMTSPLRLSNARAKQELGWTPRFPTYREGAAEVAAALRAHPTGH